MATRRHGRADLTAERAAHLIATIRAQANYDSLVTEPGTPATTRLAAVVAAAEALTRPVGRIRCEED